MSRYLVRSLYWYVGRNRKHQNNNNLTNVLCGWVFFILHAFCSMKTMSASQNQSVHRMYNTDKRDIHGHLFHTWVIPPN